MEAKSFGLKVYATESNCFPESVSYEEIVEDPKKGKYIIIYLKKKTKREIIAMIVNKNIKFTAPDNIFRKI